MKTFFGRMYAKANSVGVLFQGFVALSAPQSGQSVAGPLADWFKSNSLPGFFQASFNLAFSAGAILAVLRLSYAGWLYMSSDAFGKKTQAKEVIVDAMLGLFLLIGIWIILHQINPCLLNLNFLQDLNSTGATCSLT